MTTEHTEQDNHKILTAVSILALEPMENMTLAAANNAMHFTGTIHPRNLAFAAMRDASLIKEDGTPHDKESLLSALAYEINRRVDNGTFA